jgi:hypothetical protein
MLELMGWRSEPLLLKRLGAYIAQAFVELILLSIAMTLVLEHHLEPSRLFVRMLIFPGLITAVKLVWAVFLAFGYFRIRSVDAATMMKRMGFVHTRTFWMCSQVMFTCFSCILMVWHAILLLLMMGYVPCKDDGDAHPCKDGDGQAVRFLLVAAAVLCFIHWAIWRDFVHNFDGDREEQDTSKVEQIREMYKSKEMRIVKYKDLVGTKGNSKQNHRATSTVCAICLDDFVADRAVSELPCGHCFHPACVHRWLCQDWRCPLRCELAACVGAKYPETSVGGSSAPPNSVASDSSSLDSPV